MGFRYYLRNAYSDEIELADPYLVQGVDGLGLPPVEYFTRHGVYQTGDTVVHQRWKARTISIGVNIVGTSDATYQAARLALASMLKNIGEDLFFAIELDGGVERYMAVRYGGQLTMPTKAKGGVYRTASAFRLTASKPMWYDPTTTIWSYALGSGDGTWGYGVGLPEGFGASVLDVTQVRTYVGTEAVNPKVYVYGPAEDFLIENETTDEKLDLTGHSIGSTEVVTVDLGYGVKSVESSTDNTELADFLANDSDFTFHLAPHPEGLGGSNTMHISFVNGTTSTRAEIRFNAQYSAV